jgi:ParB-like chromosome segregation protein Spo0J
MQLTTMSLSDLRPAPYNPRVRLTPGDARYRKLKRSVERFGLVEPLVWNRRTGHLVGGHQRYQILCDLGYDEAPVSVVDLPPEQEKALNVVLNNREAQADWDLPQLTTLLEELASLPVPELASTGFDPSHLRTLQDQLTPVEAVPVEELASGYEITLKVSEERLSAVQADLDVLIQKHDLEVHLRHR